MPEAEIWMDNWCIPKGRRTSRKRTSGSTSSSIPRVSRTGTTTATTPGSSGVQDAAEEAGLEYLDIIFFDEATVAGRDHGRR